MTHPLTPDIKVKYFQDLALPLLKTVDGSIDLCVSNDYIAEKANLTS